MLLTIAVFVLAALSGLFIALGLRGRMPLSVHPVCCRCGHPAVMEPGTASQREDERCSECGAALNPHGLQFFTRSRSWVALGLGAVLLVVTLAAPPLVTMARRAIPAPARSPDVSIDQLIANLDDDRRAFYSGRPIRDLALSEFTSRAAEGSLPPGALDRAVDAIEARLARSPGVDPSHAECTLINTGLASGELTAERAIAFATSVFGEWRPPMPTHARVGTRRSLQAPSRETRGLINCGGEILDARLNGAPLVSRAGTPVPMPLTGTASLQPAAPGDHLLELTVRLAYSFDGTHPAPFAKAELNEVVRMRIPFVVVAKDAPSWIAVQRGDDVARRVRDLIRPRRVVVDPSPTSDDCIVRLDATIGWTKELPLAYRAELILDDGSAHPLGGAVSAFAWPYNTRSVSRPFPYFVPLACDRLQGTHATIRFTPAPELVEQIMLPDAPPYVAGETYECSVLIERQPNVPAGEAP